MKHKTIVQYFKKCGLTNAHYVAEDSALFDVYDSSDSNNGCDSSGEDFRGFCDSRNFILHCLYQE